MTRGESDPVLIVLGGGVSTAGALPPWVIARLELALNTVQPHTTQLILLSGYAQPGQQITVSEAAAMAAWLVQQGFPATRILLEEQSFHTISNAYYSRLLLDQRGLTRAIVITNEFHLPRSRNIFEWVFGSNYELSFLAAPNSGVDPVDLQKRQALETALTEIYTEVFYNTITAGDLQEICAAIFNDNHPATRLHNRRLQDLKLERTLY